MRIRQQACVECGVRPHVRHERWQRDANGLQRHGRDRLVRERVLMERRGETHDTVRPAIATWTRSRRSSRPARRRHAVEHMRTASARQASRESDLAGGGRARRRHAADERHHRTTMRGRAASERTVAGGAMRPALSTFIATAARALDWPVRPVRRTCMSADIGSGSHDGGSITPAGGTTSRRGRESR